MNAVVFCLGDVGANVRLLRYAKYLLKRGGTVYLIGFDGFEVPRSLSKHPNLSVTFLFSFWDYPRVLGPLLWGFEFLFLMVQMVGVALNISMSVQFVICQDVKFVMEPLIGKLVALVTGAKLVCDAVSCAWFASEITKAIGKRMIGLADIRVSSTRAMQRIFEVGGLSSRFLPDIPSKEFKPREEARRIVRKMYELPENCCCVAVTLLDSASYIDALRDIAKTLENHKVNACFFLCGHSKLCDETYTGEFPYSKFANKYAKFFAVPYQYDVYPTVLAACNFGICEHGSPNVLDIAMPILEMQVCGLPILALRYGCITEYVKDGVNGFLFDDAIELRKLLNSILIQNTHNLEEMREFNAASNWDTVFDNVLS